MNHLGRRVVAPARPHRGEKEHQRLSLLERFLGHGSHAATRNIQHVETDETSRVFGEDAATNGLDGYFNNGPWKPPPFLQT